MSNPLLADQKQQLELLLSLLLQEHKALTHDDMSALLAVAQEKQQTLDLIAKTDQHIASSAELPAMKQAPEMQELQSLLQQVQAQNKINGEVITSSNERIQQLSQVVNQLRHQNASTYDKLGQKRSGDRLGKGFKA